MAHYENLACNRYRTSINGEYACTLLPEGRGVCPLGSMDCRQCRIPMMPENIRMGEEY